MLFPFVGEESIPPPLLFSLATRPPLHARSTKLPPPLASVRPRYIIILSCPVFLSPAFILKRRQQQPSFLPSSVFTGCSGGYRRRRRKWVGQTCRLPILWRRGDERGGEGRALFPPSLHAHPFPTHSFIGPSPLPPSSRPSAKLRDLCGGRGKRKMDFLSSPNYLKAGEQKRERKGEEEVGIFHPTLLKEELNGRSPLVYRVERKEGLFLLFLPH